MGVKHVLVDIDRTLFPSLEFGRRARMAALRAMRREGMRASVRRAYGVLAQVVKERGPNYQHHFSEMMRKLGEGKDARVVAAGVYAYHEAKRRIRPFPGARRALGMMRRAGLKTYLASEGRAVKQWDKVLRMGLQGHFDGAFISEELGVGKSREFYRKIVKRLRAAPEEVLMVGDKEDRDVGPARGAGLRTILLDRKAGGKRNGVARNLLEAARMAKGMM